MTSVVRALPLALVCASGSVACSDGVSPTVDGFRFDGQAKDSPLVLLLGFHFTDPDGNLGGGTLSPFINQRPTGAGALPLSPLFLRAGLADDATDGDIDFVLELAVADELPPSGTKFRLGMRVEDEDGNTSATPEITLQIEH